MGESRALRAACLRFRATFSRVFRSARISQLKPDKVYYVGGFGVLSKWLPVNEYEVSTPGAEY